MHKEVVKLKAWSLGKPRILSHAHWAAAVFVALVVMMAGATAFGQPVFNPGSPGGPGGPPPGADEEEDAGPPPAAPANARVVEIPEGTAATFGDVVDDVRVTGNRRVDPQSVLAQVRTKVGKPIDADVLSEDIKRIFRLGFFDDVQVDATKTKKGPVVVTFIIKEKPAIAEIRYKGNDELDGDDISEVVNLKRNAILSEFEVKANAEKIRELYAEKGYFLAEVEYEIEQAKDREDLAVVTFIIDEFAKIEVKRVTFLGNENVPDEDLKNIMATREGDWGSFLTSFGSFKERAFQEDLQRITAYYYDQGYVQVKVRRPSLRLSRDKRYIYVTIRVDEGPRFNVGNVEIKGDFIADEEELYDLIELDDVAKSDNPVFSLTKLRGDAEKLRTLYTDAGYAYANVNPLNRPNAAEKTVDITYDIQKGNQVYFGRIEVVGNTKTRDKVIRRELRIEEGQLYSNTALQESRRRVLRLGFFEKVEITTQRTERSDIINARVEITERPTGTFQIGAGFSSLESFIFNAQISQNNLFGRGQSLGFQAQVSSIRTLFNVQFSEPYLFDLPLRFSFDLYNFDFLFQDFARTSRGGNMTFGYPVLREILDDELVLALTYKLEDVELRPGGQSGREAQQVGNLFRGGLTSSLRLSLAFDNRNDRLFPTSGTYSAARVELAEDTITLSDNEFLKYDFETRWYFPLPVWEFVLRLNGELGYVQSVDPQKPVPLFERYFVGGPTTVRGFDRFSLGPARQVAANTSDPSSSLSDFVIGGNKRLILTAEIEFPILTAIGIKGVVFADAGNAFDDDQPFALKLDLFADDINNYDDALRTSVGFGFRWFSPIGPLRFEWGIPLARLRDEKPLVFDFSIGNAF